jgi:hypothetical protein
MTDPDDGPIAQGVQDLLAKAHEATALGRLIAHSGATATLNIDASDPKQVSEFYTNLMAYVQTELDGLGKAVHALARIIETHFDAHAGRLKAD